MIGGNLSMEELRRGPHWSYSSLNLLLNICPLQFAYRYVYGQEPAFTPVHLVFGQAFHQACFYALRKADTTLPDLLDGFSGFLASGCRASEPAVRFDDGESFDSLNTLGRKMLEAWLPSLPPGERVVAVAVPFSARLRDADGTPLERPLVGEFDLIVEGEGGRSIVDIKTSARRWPESRPRLDLQATCYLYAAQEHPEEHITGFRFDVVTRAKAPAVERHPAVRDPDCFTRLAEMLRVAERIVGQELFLPSDQSFACGDCPYGLACQAWHRGRARSHYDLRLAA